MTSDPTQRFSDRAADYACHRPDYPSGLLETLVAESGLGALPPSLSPVVADIGAGTGILTRALAAHTPAGTRFFALEPNAAMRAAARYEGLPVTSLEATAEATTLAQESVHLITAGQAFHWFRPEPTREEFRRILYPGGRVALIWNEREPDPSPFAAAYAALLDPWMAGDRRLHHTRIDPSVITAFFAPFSFRTFTFPHSQTLDWDGFLGRTLSSSFTPNRNHPQHAAFVSGLHRLFEGFAQEGLVTLPYRSILYLGTLSHVPS